MNWQHRWTYNGVSVFVSSKKVLKAFKYVAKSKSLVDLYHENVAKDLMNNSISKLKVSVNWITK